MVFCDSQPVVSAYHQGKRGTGSTGPRVREATPGSTMGMRSHSTEAARPSRAVTCRCRARMMMDRRRDHSSTTATSCRTAGGFGEPGAGIAISIVCASGNPLGNADPQSVQGIAASLWIQDNGYSIGAQKTKTTGGSGSLSGSLSGHATLGWPFFYRYDWTCEVEG